MTRLLVVPVQLGCCAEEKRCRLCPPAPGPPTPDFVRELIANYQRERMRDDDRLQVAFFGGQPPSEALLEACGDIPKSARVRPDLLTRDAASRLKQFGVTEIELDVLTFSDHALRTMRRNYPAKRIVTMCEALRTAGFQVGVVLAPGLPNTTRETAITDVETACNIADFIRIHPVLVLANSGLQQWHLDQMYEPLELAAAIDVCAEMLDICDSKNTRVIRLGMQPGPDGFGRSVAGPAHTSLRELVEAKRTLEQLRILFAGVPSRTNVTILCAPADETRTRGPLNQHIRTLRADYRLAEVSVSAAEHLDRGSWEINVLEACNE